MRRRGIRRGLRRSEERSKVRFEESSEVHWHLLETCNRVVPAFAEVRDQ
jgi:hypothetical protein